MSGLHFACLFMVDASLQDLKLSGNIWTAHSDESVYLYSLG